MTSNSPGITVAPKQEALFHMQPLEDPEIKQGLNTLKQVFESMYGPNGRLKVVHNNSGGHVTLTSACGRLLQVLSVSKPVVRLVTTAIQGHLNSCSDGGLFVGLLSLYLIDTSLKYDIHRHLLTDIYDLILKLCVDYLNSSECECKVELDSLNFDELRKLVCSVIRSKPGCCLFGKDIDFICTLTLQAFLKSVPTSEDRHIKPSDGYVHFIHIEGKPVTDSYVADGVLFEVPQIPVYKKDALTLKTDSLGKVCVALFNISLAGDSDHFVDAKYEIHSGVSIDDVVLDAMRGLCDTLVAQQVGLVLCQKVVHPSVKKYLLQNRVMVLDRLSLKYIGAAQMLAGCQALGSLQGGVDENQLGSLDSVRHVVIQGRSYVHLQRKGAPVCTVVLCHRSPEALEELQYTMQTCQHVLRTALREPRVLCGGGCWQVHMAAYIRSQMDGLSEEWMDQLGCSKLQLLAGCDNFTQALEMVAMTIQQDKSGVKMVDTTNQHMWTSVDRGASCACGKWQSNSDQLEFEYLGVAKKGKAQGKGASECKPKSSIMLSSSSPEVLDSFPVMLSGLQCAVSVANMILSLQHCIHDVN